MPLSVEPAGSRSALPHPPAREAAPGGRVRVAVCIATFNRPVMLRALLVSLGAQQLRKRDAEVMVVVVDNDAAATARPVVESCRAALPFALHYLVEPERNISLARNRGVALALGEGADFAAFIDDDEVAHPGWLDELLAAQARYDADAVSGAVLPSFAPGAPAWVVNGGFFGMPRHRSGTELAVANTNNVLVAARLLRQFERPFHPGFGVTGGGDSHFFLRCRRAGARLVYADEAVVEEAIPPSRARTRWILRRAFRTGNCSVFCELALPPQQRRLARRVTRALGRMAVATLFLPLSPLSGRRGVMTALWSVCYGVGSLAALGGYRYVEYRSVHGE